MRRFLLVGLVFSGVVVASGAAFSDDESDRKALISSIDDKVEDMADELSGFESDSSVSDLEDALSYAREVKDLVRRLEGVKGDDSRAASIVSSYPGYLESFSGAAQQLRKMKELQRLADGIADRCASDEATLQSSIRGHVAKPDDADDAFTALPEQARGFGRTWSEKLDKLKESEGDLQRALPYARFSGSDNKWSYVSSNFNSASSAIAAYWNERYRAAGDACKRLALGDKHPDVVKALEELGKYKGNAKETVTQLKKDYNEWLREARKLRKFSDEDRDGIREAICTAGEYEMEAKVNAVADRWSSQISSVYGTMLGVADRLKSRAADSKLAKYKGPKEVMAGIEKNLANMEKLKSYELLGSNNPNLRARMEWGKKRHEELQRGCSISELAIVETHCNNLIRPGSGCRLDCLKSGSTCQIIEFKPDSQGAKTEGATQLAQYRQGLDNWYARDKDGLLKKHSELASCERSDKSGLNLSVEVVTYELCSATVRNNLGQIIDELTLELPESGE